MLSNACCSVVPPHFSGEDSSLSVSKQVTQNSTFLLRCPARAVPTPTITWYKDGHEIDPLTSERLQLVKF